MSRAVLSIGSNLDSDLGSPLDNLRFAVATFSGQLQGASGVFRTPPWGGVEQRDYLNAVLIVSDPEADAAEWLARSQATENEAGRVREVRWGPRTLDVDVITVEDPPGVQVVSTEESLTLPHPRAHERAFVLVPWWSLDPEAVLAGHGTVLSLLQRLSPAEVDAVTVLPGVELSS